MWLSSRSCVMKAHAGMQVHMLACSCPSLILLWENVWRRIIKLCGSCFLLPAVCFFPLFVGLGMWDWVIAMYARIMRSGDINCQTPPCLFFIYDLSEGKKWPLWERNQGDSLRFSRVGRSRAIKICCCCVCGTSGLWTQLPLQLTRSCEQDECCHGKTEGMQEFR